MQSRWRIKTNDYLCNVASTRRGIYRVSRFRSASQQVRILLEKRKIRSCTKSSLLENWSGYAVLKITKKPNFQADVLDKISDGIDNPTMGTGSTNLDEKNLNSIYCLFSKLKALENAKLWKKWNFHKTREKAYFYPTINGVNDILERWN